MKTQKPKKTRALKRPGKIMREITGAYLKTPGSHADKIAAMHMAGIGKMFGHVIVRSSQKGKDVILEMDTGERWIYGRKSEGVSYDQNREFT